MANLREEYESWLRGQISTTGPSRGELLKPSSVTNTARALEHGVSQLPDVSITPSNLFYCNDYDTFCELEDKIRLSQYFQNVNQKEGKGYFSQGLTRYKEFLDCRRSLLNENYIRYTEADDDAYDKAARSDPFYSEMVSFDYHSMPRNPELESADSPNAPRFKRHKDRARNALGHANYLCEIDGSHLTFKRRNSNVNYTEPHHLIPMRMQVQFAYTLDTEENIVSLCSHCHNKIHYGDGTEELTLLFSKRKNLLEAAGIRITLKDLLGMYQ